MSDLKRIVKLAELLVKAQADVKSKDLALKEARQAALQLEREDLPLLMTELGLTEIRLEDGSLVQIKEDVDARITEANRGAALKWLLDHEYGGLIKTEVAITFGRGDHEKAIGVRDQLASTYDGVALLENVHHSTLKAFVRERLMAGDDMPFDLFGIHPYSKAIIKR